MEEFCICAESEMIKLVWKLKMMLQETKVFLISWTLTWTLVKLYYTPPKGNHN